MIYFIIAFVIDLVFAIHEGINFGWWDGVKQFFLFSIVGFVLALIVWTTFGSFVGIFLPKTVVEVSTPIVALKDSSQVEGNFFLGVGGVFTEAKYTFMMETDEGFLIKEIKDSGATIKYGDIPTYTTRTKKLARNGWYWIATPFFASDPLDYITVTEGSIINGYKIYLK